MLKDERVKNVLANAATSADNFAMITKNEYYEIGVNNPDFTVAREILLSAGTDFRRCSCNLNVIKRIINDKDKSVIIALVKESNSLDTDIEEVIMRYDANKALVDDREEFFQAFEGTERSERLFIIIGETGVGKSWIVEHRFPTLPIYGVTKALDPYSLLWDTDDVDGTGLKKIDTPFLKCVKEGRKVIMDELNAGTLDLNALIQVLTDKKEKIVFGHEEITIHPNFKIIATMNPPSDTDERTPMGDALQGRAVGYVMELTDDIITARLKVTDLWLSLVRQMLSLIKNTGMVDVRELNYRDYEKFVYYNFETQLKFKVCMGDVTNIKNFAAIQKTGEYQRLLRMIKEERKKR